MAVRRIRILKIAPAFYPALYWGGAISSMYGLYNALAARNDVEVKVLSTDSAGPRRRDRIRVDKEPAISARGYPIYYCRRIARATVSLTLLERIMPLVRWCDVVHLSSVYSFPTMPTLLAVRYHRKPLLWSPHGSLQVGRFGRHRHLKTLWDLLCSALVSESTLVHVTSAVEAAASVKRYGKLSVRCIPHGVELPHLVRREPRKKELRLLFLGRLHPIKGLENLLSGVAGIDCATTPWTLEIAGDGDAAYSASLRAIVRRLKIDQYVTFLGRVEPAQRSSIFARSDVLILPSFQENFGLVVAEALSHSVPVIVSRGAPWSDVEAHGCGLWVPNSVEALRDAISRVAGLPIEEMGRKGRDWMAREYTWDRRAEEVVSCLRSLLACNTK